MAIAIAIVLLVVLIKNKEPAPAPASASAPAPTNHIDPPYETSPVDQTSSKITSPFDEEIPDLSDPELREVRPNNLGEVFLNATSYYRKGNALYSLCIFHGEGLKRISIYDPVWPTVSKYQ